MLEDAADHLNHSADPSARPSVLRWIGVAGVWMISAQWASTSLYLPEVHSPYFWPANGIAYGIVTVLGWDAVLPSALGALLWNLGVARNSWPHSLVAVGVFTLSLVLLAYFLPRVRRQWQDRSSTVPEALRYYGLLLGLGVTLTSLGALIPIPGSQAVAGMGLVAVFSQHWLSAAVGVLYFTRWTAISVAWLRARFSSGGMPARSPLWAAPRQIALAILWLVAMTGVTAASLMLLESGAQDLGLDVDLLNFLLLAVLVFRYAPGFTHFALMITGMGQALLMAWYMTQGGDTLLRWQDWPLFMSIFAVFVIFGSATMEQLRWVQKRIQQQLACDAPTGLLNDRGFARALAQFVREAAESPYLLGVSILRVGGQGDLADYSARQGTEQALAQTLEQLLQSERYLLARSRAGAFVLAVVGEARAQVMVEQIWRELDGLRYPVGDQALVLQLATAAWPVSSPFDAEALLSQLELALEVAALRPDRRVFYGAQEFAGVAAEWRLRRQAFNHLEDALHRPATAVSSQEDGLCLYAQAVRDLHEPHRLGCEILLRWRYQGTLHSPETFLPLIERHALSALLDRWVLRETLMALTEGALPPEGDWQVSINLSGASLADHGLQEDFCQLLRESGIAPQHLCFELTETAAIHNLELAQETLNTLKGMGVDLALDDFGSGLASFAYLRKFRFDKLKIDGLFVKNLMRSTEDRITVAAMGTVARSMHLYTVAEYVEDAATAQLLYELGIDAVQGFGIGAPMPLSQWLAEAPLARPMIEQGIAVRG